MPNLEVIYEYNHLIVVVKEENLLSQKDKTEDEDILSLVKAYLKEKYQKLGNVYLGLVHRLDRRVGGVMVFAKTSKAASRLSKAIRERDFEKKYLAICTGKVESGILKHKLIKKDQMALESKEGKEAVLEYKVIKYLKEEGLDYTLVDVDLITGRYNQIRAQFALIGHPLINDFKYGYQGKNYFDQLGLWCYELKVPHPITKEQMSFKKIPEGGIWSFK